LNNFNTSCICWWFFSHSSCDFPSYWCDKWLPTVFWTFWAWFFFSLSRHSLYWSMAQDPGESDSASHSPLLTPCQQKPRAYLHCLIARGWGGVSSLPAALLTPSCWKWDTACTVMWPLSRVSSQLHEETKAGDAMGPLPSEKEAVKSNSHHLYHLVAARCGWNPSPCWAPRSSREEEVGSAVPTVSPPPPPSSLLMGTSELGARLPDWTHWHQGVGVGRECWPSCFTPHSASLMAGKGGKAQPLPPPSSTDTGRDKSVN
jgi:hypothetical protein